MLRIAILVICLIQVFTFSVSNALAARHALVIGNADYDELTDLKNTHADAEAYHKIFLKLGFNSILKKDLDFEATWDTLDQLLETIRDGDQVAFVYSGHGWSDGASNFLSPTDASKSGSERQLKRDSIPLSNGQDGVLDELRAAGVSLTFAVIDACRNNPYTPLPGKRSAGISRGLARIDNQQGSFIVFSAGAGQEALDRVPSDDADQKLSVFSRHFIPKLASNMYLEDAISASQVETQALALTYGGHRQLPIYEDGTAGKTCLSERCSVPAQDTQDNKEFAALRTKTEIKLTIHEQMARNVAVQQCDQAAGSLDHPDYLAGNMLVEPPTYKKRNGSLGIATCTTALANFPNQPRLLANLGLAHSKLKNDKRAFAIFKNLATKGDPFSWERLGNLYELGSGVEQDYTLALKWYLKAADRDFSFAQYRLGMMYKHGNGVEQDYHQAVKWYRKATEQGDSAAQNNLAVMYEEGLGIVQDYQQAVKLYQKSIKHGDSNAQNNLALMYKFGNGVKQDYEQALIGFRKAAKQSNSNAQNNIGVMYEFGQGINQDYQQAVIWYKKAAEQGNSYAQNNLAMMYLEGRGINQDYQQAVKWYGKAAEQGNINAQNNIGLMYEEGRGINQDYGLAVKWYRKAAEQGKSDAQNNLGIMYEDGYGVGRDFQQALKWYRKAAGRGNSKAENNIGIMYEEGRGVEQDYQQAILWYRKAAKQGNKDAQSNLAMIYTDSRDLRQNYPQTMKWYENAAEQGNRDAQNNLAMMYEDGQGVRQDYHRALKWYRKAAEQDHSDAQNNIGTMYKHGKGVKQDYQIAVKWYKKAAKQGNNSTAQNNLGIMYELGLGLGPGLVANPPRAAQLYITAIELGNDWAINQKLNTETNKAIQVILRTRRLYSGSIDGILGYASKAAMRKLLAPK